MQFTAIHTACRLALLKLLAARSTSLGEEIGLRRSGHAHRPQVASNRWRWSTPGGRRSAAFETNDEPT